MLVTVQIPGACQRSLKEVAFRQSFYVVAFVAALAAGVGTPPDRTAVAAVQHGLHVGVEVSVVVVDCLMAILVTVLSLDQDLEVVAVLVVDLVKLVW